jgi:hypothetical protein
MRKLCLTPLGIFLIISVFYITKWEYVRGRGWGEWKSCGLEHCDLVVHRKAFLTINFLELIVVSLDHLKCKLYRPLYLLHLKETLLLNITSYGSNLIIFVICLLTSRTCDKYMNFLYSPNFQDSIKKRYTLWGKKTSPQKMDNFQSNSTWSTLYSNLCPKGKVSSSLTLKISCEQLYFHIGMGSSPLTRKFHEEHNDT